MEVASISGINLPGSNFNACNQVDVKNDPDFSETVILPVISWDNTFENGFNF